MHPYWWDHNPLGLHQYQSNKFIHKMVESLLPEIPLLANMITPPISPYARKLSGGNSHRTIYSIIVLSIRCVMDWLVLYPFHHPNWFFFIESIQQPYKTWYRFNINKPDKFFDDISLSQTQSNICEFQYKIMTSHHSNLQRSNIFSWLIKAASCLGDSRWVKADLCGCSLYRFIC